MRPAHEAYVTPDSGTHTAPGASDARAAGVWTLTGERLIIAEADGPATILVPTEQVRLLAVDLPLSSRAKRLEALPFAIEDQIAEPIDSLHLALGAEIAPKRYLVGVVRHEVMARWVELAEAGGLGRAAIVPDALALPRPAEGSWAVDLGETRALVRSGDGSGFAVPAPLLGSAWDSAGKPPAIAYGAMLPPVMMLGREPLAHAALAVRLLSPALDLRQGRYAARGAGTSGFWRKAAWIVGIGAAAHAGIAIADTAMLRHIADPDTFLPLLSRVSGALQPLAGSLRVRQLSFEGSMLTMDVEGSDPALTGKIDAALHSAQLRGSATRTPDGAIRIRASAA